LPLKISKGNFHNIQPLIEVIGNTCFFD